MPRINWERVHPSTLPEGSPVRKALEDGRPDVAEWLATTYRGGENIYVASEKTHRRLVFGELARGLVRVGAITAREAERRFGVPRGRL